MELTDNFSKSADTPSEKTMDQAGSIDREGREALRFIAAVCAMQGILAAGDGGVVYSNSVAGDAANCADALLRQLGL